MKKALSIILALTLAFSLLPTFAFAAETTETETAETMDWSQPIVFDFGVPTNNTAVNSENSYISGAEIYAGDTWQFISYKKRTGLLDGDVVGATDAKKRVSVVTYNNINYIKALSTEKYAAAAKNTVSFALKVSDSGIYDISAKVYNTSSGTTTKGTLKHITQGTSIDIGTIENLYKNGTDIGPAGPVEKQFSEGVGVPVAKTVTWNAPGGTMTENDNQIQFTINENLGFAFCVYYVKFTPSTINSATVTAPVTEYKVGDTFTPAVSLNVEGVGDKTYSDLAQAGIALGVKEADAGVTVENNVYTVAKSGEITFTPTVTVNGKTHDAAQITLSVESDEDEALTNAFEVKKEELKEYVEPSVVSVSAGGSVITPEKNADGSYNIEAAEENKDGEKFLYWAKGLTETKRIISFSNKLENYIPDEAGADWLIAVYEDKLPETNEYYNANGQLIATGEEPELPSMAGYGEATAWNRYEETNIYVAEYNGKTQPDDVTVTVNGETKTVPYGTEITCTATAANFKCWTKSNINGKTEIVSAENVYKFKAWEDCSVDAVNEAYNYNGDRFKIVVDSFNAGNETGIMAEFIGFGSNVVEKGIMWNNNKIAMTKPGSQFSIIADKNGEYKGYAIVGNEQDGYALIVDGEVTLANAE